VTDVVVIGGGPAGSSAAIRLARTGRKVRLYEKSHFPRPKLCGGFLSTEGLEDLENLDILSSLRNSGAIPLYRSVLAPQRGGAIESALPGEALSVSRDVLDHLLLEKARTSGVDVHEGEDGFNHSEEGAFTVMASGRMSPSPDERRRNHFFPWYASPSTHYFGIQAFFQGVTGVTDQVELDLVEDGYVGLAPLSRGVNVCALTTQRALQRWGPDLDQVLAHFTDENPTLRRHLATASRTGDWLAVGPVRLGIRRLARDRTFYIGDAACVVDPFAGEGMSIGLYSSKLLTRALDQTSMPPAEAYARLWRNAFLPALRWNAALRFFYAVPFLREPTLAAMEWFPRALTWATDLTRYRRLESL